MKTFKRIRSTLHVQKNLIVIFKRLLQKRESKIVFQSNNFWIKDSNWVDKKSEKFSRIFYITVPLKDEYYHLQQHPHPLPGRPEEVEGAGSSLHNRTEFKGTFSRDFEPSASAPASAAGALGGGHVE